MTSETTASSSSKKRTVDELENPDSGNPKKAAKLFPIFNKGPSASEQQSTFAWTQALGSQKTCLHGINLSPTPSSKVAAFDLDGCIIQGSFSSKTKGKARADDPTFRWWRPVVPEKLKELHEDGFSIVIITNQALRGSEAIKLWKKNIPLVAAALDIPFHIFAATARDGYRKPMPGIWYELEKIFSQHDAKIDKSISFFIGDAAGRKGDFAGTDRKLALNVKIPFYTPEEFFLGLPPAQWTLKGFTVSSLPSDLPRITPTSTPLVSAQSSPEIVLFVGLPALGKSSFYWKHFHPEGYVHVNQDTLKTRQKCVKAVEDTISSGKRCVVDNTNRDTATRKYYIDVARKHGVAIRCILFKGSLELAWHNNLYRAFNTPPEATNTQTQMKRELVPYSAFLSFQKDFEEPTIEEGFSEIKVVNWIFDGNDEERERWSMWLQIDGE